MSERVPHETTVPRPRAAAEGGRLLVNGVLDRLARYDAGSAAEILERERLRKTPDELRGTVIDPLRAEIASRHARGCLTLAQQRMGGELLDDLARRAGTDGAADAP